MDTAVKLKIHIPEDHMVKLPDDLPVGQAEMIILVPAAKTAQAAWTPPPGTPDSVEWLREDRDR